MSFVRTVLGDIKPEEMGLCYSHEHIVIEESYPTVLNGLLLLNDVEKIVQELKQFYGAGGRTMVDTMPANAGRNILKLAEVSRKSRVNIIAPTGVHLEKYYLPNHWRYHYSEDQLTQLFIDDIRKGIDIHDYNGPIVKRSSHKAGLIKLATGDEKFTPHQKKIFRAVANTQKETGAPILTHTNYGRRAIDQVNMFDKLGVDLSKVVLSHIDRKKDIAYNREVLESGVYVEYDSAFRWNKDEENWTYKLLEHLLSEFSDQITMGMDAAKHTYWKSYGGKPGLTFLIDNMEETLTRMGLGDCYEQIFFTNPSQLYAFKAD